LLAEPSLGINDCDRQLADIEHRLEDQALHQIPDLKLRAAAIICWAIMRFPAGKRLAPFMAEIVPVLERHGELRLTPEVCEKLLSMSAATIDRLLAHDRRRLEIKGRTGTKPGTLLKNTIPIRTLVPP